MNVFDATDFGGAIEAAHKVRCDVVLRCVRRRAKVTELQNVLCFIDLKHALA